MSTHTDIGGDSEGWVTAAGAVKVIEKTHAAWVQLIEQADTTSEAHGKLTADQKTEVAKYKVSLATSCSKECTCTSYGIVALMILWLTFAI